MKNRWSLLSCIRYREVLLLQGPPLMGVVLSVGKLTVAKIPHIALLAVAGFLLVAHIWSLNDWADIHADTNDPNKSENVFSCKGVNPPAMLRFSIALLIASLCLFAMLGRVTLLIAASIALLGFFYSHSGINAKGMPVLSSMPHLIGGLLHFLLGYSLFAPIGAKAVMTASFFALTFTAGHFAQEVQDYEGDRSRGVRTNAVVFGKTTVFVASFVLFTLAYASLLWLSLAGIMPRRLWIFPLLLFPLHCYWSLDVLLRGLSHDRVARFRGRYQALFALIGLGMISTLFF